MKVWLVAALVVGCQKSPAPASPAAASETPDASSDAPRQATATAAWTLPTDAAPALEDPQLATERAPNVFDVRFTTSKGDLVVRVNRAWAPHGADRFFNLVQSGFYDHSAFFRTVDGFVAQFGLSAYPEVNAAWLESEIRDDPVLLSNTRGRLTFASRGPNTRTTQLFFNLKDNSSLDGMGFAPVAEVVEGLEVLDALHRTGEGPPRGAGPDQMRIRALGNAHLDENFPQVDRISEARVVTPTE